MEKRNRISEKQLGVIVFTVLAVVTAIEYFIALIGVPVAVLILMAIIKAGAVLYYFMHIRRVFSKGEGE